MTDVRIRHAWQYEPVHLADVPFSELDDVVAMIERWGVVDADGTDMFGQFVIGPTAAYFEVVVIDADDV